MSNLTIRTALELLGFHPVILEIYPTTAKQVYMVYTENESTHHPIDFDIHVYPHKDGVEKWWDDILSEYSIHEWLILIATYADLPPISKSVVDRLKEAVTLEDRIKQWIVQKQSDNKFC